MAINLAFTALCLVRWRDCHEGIAPQNYVEQTIDEVYDDYKTVSYTHLTLPTTSRV